MRFTKMQFTKMHGAGNDYVYVNCFAEPVPDDPAELARQMSHRHFGIGADGLVLICPSEVADAEMRMFNADGSESEMCGNAIRCVAKYLYDHDLCRKEEMAIETGAGVLTLDLEIVDGAAERVRVEMGEPILVPADVPTTLQGNDDRHSGAVVQVPIEVGGEALDVTCVSMGNPHCVTFVDELSDHWVLQVGPRVEVDSRFPNRINAEFVEVISPAEVKMRVWERGSGETWACGTGACAVCVAGVLTGQTDRTVLVHLLGGELKIQWADNNRVYMTGPAVEVFSGEWVAGE